MTVHEQKEKSGITIPEKQNKATTSQKMNAFDYRKLITNNKFHAKRFEYNGTVYDSKKEAKRASVLEQQEKYGIIKNLQKQVKFELQPAYTNNQGKKIRAIQYIADFVYEQDNKIYVEDVKGSRKTLTDAYKIKRKLFEYKYPGYYFVEFI